MLSQGTGKKVGNQREDVENEKRIFSYVTDS